MSDLLDLLLDLLARLGLGPAVTAASTTSAEEGDNLPAIDPNG